MSDDTNTQVSRKGDLWVDAVAAVALLAIFVTTAAYWISSQ